jgi:uncharacterized membrane protein YdjX (TVP38/TMEM64 family)
MRRAPFAAGLGLLALVVAAFLGIWLSGGDIAAVVPSGLSADQVAARIRSWGGWGIAGSLVLMAAHSFVPFPAELVAIANGMVFGLVLGTAITWTGAMLGAVVAFALARWLGRPFVHAILPARHAAALDRWTARQGAGVLLISRFLPVVSFNLINYAAGLTAVSWWTFLWTTGLGILPLTFLMVLAGNQMINGYAKLTIIVLAACIGASLLWIIVMRRREREPPPAPPG